MTDGTPRSPAPGGHGGGHGGGQRGSTLGLRLALAFLGVSLAAVALLAVLAAVFSAVDVSSLGNRQRSELASAFAVAAAGSWNADRGWAGADLTPVLDVAAHSGVQLQVRDDAGHPIATTSGFSAAQEPKSSEPVRVNGRQVGTVQVGLTASGLGAADNVLRTALLRAIAGTAGLAALLALIAGLGVARRITRPVTRLITVTRAMAGGDRSARAGQVSGPGELRELAAAFDQMADTLDREDKIRRDLVASVAHELRTPVAVLQAGHEALLDGVIEATPNELGSLRDEVLRLARMVDDLQTMAAADAAVLRLTRAHRDLATIAAAAADSLSHRFEAASVTLDSELAEAPVVADERWLHQVVTNLLGNALKFTPGRRPGHGPHPADGAGRGADGHRHWRRHPGRRAAARLRAVLARPGRGRDVRQRHRPRHRRRARPGARRHARRRQRAGPGNDAHPHPAARLMPRA